MPQTQGANKNYDWLEQFVKEHSDFSIGDLMDDTEEEDESDDKDNPSAVESEG